MSIPTTEQQAEMVRRYNAEETSVEIAKRFDTSASRVIYWLRKNGVTIRQQLGRREALTPEVIARAQAMCAAGDKQVYVAAVLGISLASLNRAIKPMREAHMETLRGLLTQLERGRESVIAALDQDLEKSTRKSYQQNLARYDAQIIALQSVLS